MWCANTDVPGVDESGNVTSATHATAEGSHPAVCGLVWPSSVNVEDIEVVWVGGGYDTYLVIRMAAPLATIFFQLAEQRDR